MLVVEDHCRKSLQRIVLLHHHQLRGASGPCVIASQQLSGTFLQMTRAVTHVLAGAAAVTDVLVGALEATGPQVSAKRREPAADMVPMMVEPVPALTAA